MREYHKEVFNQLWRFSKEKLILGKMDTYGYKLSKGAVPEKYKFKKSFYYIRGLIFYFVLLLLLIITTYDDDDDDKYLNVI